MSAANPLRGEAGLRVAGEAIVLRPSFAALVAAEAELGPLFALVERAAAGALTLAELAGLVDDYRLSFEGGDAMTGRFLVTRLDYAGDFNGERSYTLSLESSGPVVAQVVLT